VMGEVRVKVVSSGRKEKRKYECLECFSRLCWHIIQVVLFRLIRLSDGQVSASEQQ
jgi:hypothetical protein